MTAVRSRAAEVMDVIADVHPGAIAILVAIVAVHRLANAAMHAASVGGVPVRKMALATEVQLGASSSSVIGGSVGTGVRIAMLRSWGVQPSAIAIGLWVTSVVPAVAMWSIAGVHALAALARGDATRMDAAIGVGSVLAWGCTFVVIRVVLRSGGRLASLADRVHAFGAAHAPTKLRPIMVALEPDALRATARNVLTAQGLLLVAAAITAQLALAVLVSASVAAVAPAATVSLLAVAHVFSTLRVVSSFVPIPGGLGIVDVGLVSALVARGLTSPQAVSAVALYRALTFVLPMLTGPCCALGWWVANRRSRVARSMDVAPVLPLTGAA